MRKDVKLGLAVGGVLLAVLVVYVLVVPGTNTNQAGATLENLDGSEIESPEGDNAGAGALAYGTPGTDATTGGQSGRSAANQQSGSTGGMIADAATANGGSDRANTSSGEKPSGESAGSESAGGWNWDALVNGTEKVPSLAAGTDVPTNGYLATAGGTVDGSSTDGSSDNGVSAGSGLSGGNGTSQNGGATNGGATNGNGSATATGSSVLSDNGNAFPSSNSPSASDTLGDATAASSSQSPAQQNGLAGGAQENANATSATPAASGSGVRTHVVKVGDTYSKISLAAYGTSKHYARIEQANPGIDPTRLKLGQTITLPEIAAKPAAAATAAQAFLDPKTEYKVQPNDSLHTISLRLYGKADRVEKIYELNKATIGDDMTRVKIGTVLKLPEPPTQSTVATSSR